MSIISIDHVIGAREKRPDTSLVWFRLVSLVYCISAFKGKIYCQNHPYRRIAGGARGVMVIVAGYGHGDTSSNPGPDWLHFT